MATRGAFDKVLSQKPRKKAKRKRELLGKVQRKTRGPRIVRT